DRRRGSRGAGEWIVERQNRLAGPEAAGGRSGNRVRNRIQLLKPGERRHQVRRADLHEMLRTGVLARAHADHPLRTGPVSNAEARLPEWRYLLPEFLFR